MIIEILLFLIGLSIVVPYALYRKFAKVSRLRCVLMNIFSFFCLFSFAFVLIMTDGIYALAYNEEAIITTGMGLRYIGAALSTGLSGIGGGVAVASAASAAINAMTKDESALGKSLIFVALAEGIALYGLVISILILNS